LLKLGKERDKLKRSLGGISQMKKIPEMLFIIDTNIESIAVKEAVKLKIPIAAILDTNSDPTNIAFPIPGNDDARRSINLYCELLRDTILDAKKYIAKKQVQVNEKKDEAKGDEKIDEKVKNISKKNKS
jgi:small subunit ribosomal protein S2